MEVKIEANPDFMIFLDNVRVDNFSKSFNSHLSINSQVNEATLEMVYIKELEQGIDFLTNLRIFVKNVFTGKYILVFDGEIQSRSISYSPDGGSTMIYTAKDNMNWLMKLMFPIFMSPLALQNGLMRFIWANNNLDIANLEHLGFTNQYNANMMGKSVSELVKDVYKKLKDLNKTVNDPESVVSWANLEERTSVMADINKSLTDDRGYILDPIVDGARMDSVYTFLVDTLSKLSFEFFQDRDGLLRIKQPFWAEGILKNHVIDPILIQSYTENRNWEAEPTRVIAQGSVARHLQPQAQTPTGQATIIPVVAYLGPPIDQSDNYKEINIGSNGDPGVFTDTSDALLVTPTPPATDNASSPPPTPSADGTSAFYVNLMYDYDPDDPGGTRSRVVSGGQYLAWRDNRYHYGLDIALEYGSLVRAQGSNLAIETVSINNGTGYGLHVVARCLDQRNINTRILYAHLSRVYVKEGDTLNGGDVIGLSGGKLDDPIDIRGTSTGPHLHLEVKPGTAAQAAEAGLQRDDRGNVHPTRYLARQAGITQTPPAPSTPGSAPTPDHNNSPRGMTFVTPRERRYGLNIYNTNQPFIKRGVGVSDEGVKKLLQRYAAYVYHLMRGSSATASLSLIGSPWIRPGFNLWIDPNGLDKVFYVASVTHVGSYESGVFTSLGLTYGRDRREFLLNKWFEIGKNVFVHDNEGAVKPDHFGKVIASTRSGAGRKEMEDTATELLTYRKNIEANNSVVVAPHSKYRAYYGEGANLDTNELGHYLWEWSFEYTPDEVQNMLNALYFGNNYVIPDNASDLVRQAIPKFAARPTPQVVKDRAQKLAAAVSASQEHLFRYFMRS